MKKKVYSEEEPLLQDPGEPSTSRRNIFKKPGSAQKDAAMPSPRKTSPKPSRPQKQPNRTTKISQKLVVFPESQFPDTQVTDLASEYGDADERVVTYPLQVAKEKEAERLSKVDKQELPRVTAYCTAKSYHMDALYAFLLSKGDSNGCHPNRIDECIYTRYIPPVSIFQFVSNPSSSRSLNNRSPFRKPGKVGPTSKYRSGTPTNIPNRSKSPDHKSFQTPPTASEWLPDSDDEDTPQLNISKNPVLPEHDTRFLQQSGLAQQPGELFFLDYGVVVMWGLSEPQEQYMLSLLKPFEEEKLDPEEIETEPFHYQYRPLSQPRIFNDVITLRAPGNNNLMDDKNDLMIKLTISHAIGQSTKLALYENRIDETITTTQYIPIEMAKTGKVPMSRHAITRKIGQLFVMRINVNLVSPILDTPEIFWSEPSLEPLYTAVRGYLEISQRVELLNQRCNVISDLLDMLKEHLNSAHGETLEWIIIILIAIEILIGLVEIFFDFYNFYKPATASVI